LGSSTTNAARCAPEITSRIAMTKTAFTGETLFNCKLHLNLRKVSLKCYILNIAFYGLETLETSGKRSEILGKV
jgi:hypothetical protein